MDSFEHGNDNQDEDYEGEPLASSKSGIKAIPAANRRGRPATQDLLELVRDAIQVLSDTRLSSIYRHLRQTLKKCKNLKIENLFKALTLGVSLGLLIASDVALTRPLPVQLRPLDDEEPQLDFVYTLVENAPSISALFESKTPSRKSHTTPKYSASSSASTITATTPMSSSAFQPAAIHSASAYSIASPDLAINRPISYSGLNDVEVEVYRQRLRDEGYVTGASIDCRNFEGKLIRRFKTLDDVRSAGLSVDGAIRCLQGKQQTSQGMAWSYYDENAIHPSDLRQPLTQGFASGRGTPSSGGAVPGGDGLVFKLSKKHSLQGGPVSSSKRAAHGDDVDKDYGSDYDDDTLYVYSEGETETAVPVASVAFTPGGIKTAITSDPILYLAMVVVQASPREVGAGLFQIIEAVQKYAPLVSKNTIVTVMRKGTQAKVFVEWYRPQGASTQAVKGGRGHGRRAHAHLYYSLSDVLQTNYDWGLECVGADGAVLRRFKGFEEITSSIAVTNKAVYNSCCGFKPQSLGDLSFKIFVALKTDPPIDSLSIEEINDIHRETKPLDGTSGAMDYNRQPLQYTSIGHEAVAHITADGSALLELTFRRKRRGPCNFSLMSLPAGRPVEPDNEIPPTPEVGDDYQAVIPDLLSPEQRQAEFEQLDRDDVLLHAIESGGSENPQFLKFVEKARLRLFPPGSIVRVCRMVDPDKKPDSGELKSSFALCCVVSDVTKNSRSGPKLLTVFDGDRAFDISLNEAYFDIGVLYRIWTSNGCKIGDSMQEVCAFAQANLEVLWTDAEIRSYFRMSAKMLYDQRNKFPYLYRLSSLSQTKSSLQVTDFHFRNLAVTSRPDGQQKLLSIFKRAVDCVGNPFDGNAEKFNAHNGIKAVEAPMVTDTSSVALEPIPLSALTMDNPFAPGAPLVATPSPEEGCLLDSWDTFFGVKYGEHGVGGVVGNNSVIPGGYPPVKTGDSFGGFPRFLDDDDNRFIGTKRKSVEQFELDTGRVVRRYPSGKSGADQMNISQGYVSACCRGLKHEAGGYGWRFYDGDVGEITFDDPSYVPIAELVESVKANLRLPRKRQSYGSHGGGGDSQEAMPGRPSGSLEGMPEVRKKKKPVEQISLETGKVERRFDSAVAAARFYGYTALQQRISLCCRGKMSHAHGYRWRFCDDADSDDEFKTAHQKRSAFAPTQHAVVPKDCSVCSRRATSNVTFIRIALEAVQYLSETKGSTVDTIRAFSVTAYPATPFDNTLLKRALRRCVNASLLERKGSRFHITEAGKLSLERQLGGDVLPPFSETHNALGKRVEKLKRSWIPTAYHVYEVLLSFGWDEVALSVEQIRQKMLEKHPYDYNCSNEDEIAALLAAVKAAIDNGIAEGLYQKIDDTQDSITWTTDMRSMISSEELRIGSVGGYLDDDARSRRSSDNAISEDEEDTGVVATDRGVEDEEEENCLDSSCEEDEDDPLALGELSDLE